MVEPVASQAKSAVLPEAEVKLFANEKISVSNRYLTAHNPDIPALGSTTPWGLFYRPVDRSRTKTTPPQTSHTGQMREARLCLIWVKG